MITGPWSPAVRAPLLRAVLPFIGGLVTARAWDPQPMLAWIVCVALLAVFLLLAIAPITYTHRWLRGVAFWFSLFGFGLLWQTLHAPHNDPHRLVVLPDQRRALLVEVTEVTGLSPRVVRCKADAVGWIDTVGTEVVEGGVLLMVRRDTMSATLLAGDRLVLRAPVNAIDRVADPGGFDRAQWAAAQGIFHEAFVETGNWLRIGHVPPLSAVFDGWRTSVSGWFDALDIAPREKGLVKALILGVRNDIDVEQRDAFARSGTMHVLAVSGMHVGLIYWILMQLMGWWGRRTWARLARGVLVLAALWAFTGLTGASPSIMRAAIMFTVFTISDMCGRQNEPMNSLSAAAFALLLIDPSMLVQLSFQLSFMAVLGIILFYKPFMRLWSPPNVVLHFIWSALCVTLAAQLMTTPLSLWAFGAFPTWFLPANLLVVTASTGAVIVGIVALIFGQVPFVGAVVQWVLAQLLWVMGEGAQWFGKLPGAYPAVRMDGLQCLLMYTVILIVAAMLAWRWRRVKWLLAACTVLLFAGWSARVDGTATGSAFVVYDYRDGVLAGMVQGRELVVLQDSSVAADAYVRRRIDAHARKWGLWNTMSLAPEALSTISPTSTGSAVHGAGLWCTDGLRVRFASSNGASGYAAESRILADGESPALASKADRSVALSALVLQGPGRFDIEALVAAHAPQHVVLAPTMELASRRYVRRWCEEHAIHCHDVRRQGAFILDIDPHAR